MNSYNIPRHRINYANIQDTYILDKKIGDVNGDKIPDLVYLIGEKKENPFYENIKIIVQDGRTMQRYVIPLCPNYSMGYNPWIFLGSFTNSNVYQIMVNLDVGGSGALTYYYVISFLNNNPQYILGPNEFIPLTENLEYEVIYMDDYKVLIKSKKLDKSYTIDVSNRKEFYEGSVYSKDGKLIKPLKGFVIAFPHLYSIKVDGSVPYKLEAQQDISGTSHVDQLGTIVTYWKYNEEGRMWVLDPETFFVMFEVVE